MTLNITLLAGSTIFQSADCRLWDPGRDTVISDTSTKLVQLSMGAMSTYVTYTGIGRWRGRDTSDWIVEWLTDRSDGSFDDIANALQEAASSWLGQIERSTGRRWAHTFMAVTFDELMPTALCLSNFESLHSAPESRPADGLLRSTLRTARPRAIVTGCSGPSVTRASRRALERLVRDHPDDPARIRNAMAMVNRDAAERQADADCPISAECTVTSLSRDGRGHATGGPPGAPVRMVMDGLDIGSILENTARELLGGGPVQVRGMTSARSDPPLELTASDCHRRESGREVHSGYDMIDLEPEGSIGGVATSTAGGVVVGLRPIRDRGPMQPFVWVEPGRGRYLPTLGGLTGRVAAVDSTGLAIGAVERPGTRRSTAVTWRLFDGDDLEQLSTDGATHSGATHLSEGVAVGGWVSYHPTEGGQVHFRPAVWRSGDFRSLRDLGEGVWGQVRDIADDGWTLVTAHEGMRIFPLLWDGEDQVVRISGATDYVIPIALSGDRQVIGRTRDADGATIGVVWSETTGWRSLGLEREWYPSLLGPDGQVAGHSTMDGFGRPWIREVGQRPVVLPHYEYHHSRLTSMSGSGGIITGQASSDHGAHPLVWKPTASV